MELEDKAKAMYTAYSAGVGGKAFNGDSLPDADTFFADPTKEKQVNGWLKAAEETRYGTKSKEEMDTARREASTEVMSLISQINSAAVDEDFEQLIELTGELQVASIALAFLKGILEEDLIDE